MKVIISLKFNNDNLFFAKSNIANRLCFQMYDKILINKKEQ